MSEEEVEMAVQSEFSDAGSFRYNFLMLALSLGVVELSQLSRIFS